MVLGTGFEPSITSLRGGLPNHLEEPSILVGVGRFELHVSGLKGQRSNHLNYTPVDPEVSLQAPQVALAFFVLFRATPFVPSSSQPTKGKRVAPYTIHSNGMRHSINATIP